MRTIVAALAFATVVGTSSLAAAGDLSVEWTHPLPPVVPSWAPAGMKALHDKDGDGLHDDFEESVAAAFAPQYRFSDGETARRTLADVNQSPIWLYQEPILLHAVTPLALDAGAITLRVK